MANSFKDKIWSQFMLIVFNAKHITDIIYLIIHNHNCEIICLNVSSKYICLK